MTELENNFSPHIGNGDLPDDFQVPIILRLGASLREGISCRSYEVYFHVKQTLEGGQRKDKGAEKGRLSKQHGDPGALDQGDLSKLNTIASLT